MTGALRRFLVVVFGLLLAGCSGGRTLNPPTLSYGALKHMYLSISTWQALVTPELLMYDEPVTASSTPAVTLSGVDALGIYADARGRLFAPIYIAPYEIVSVFRLPLTASSTAAFTLTATVPDLTQVTENASGNVYVGSFDGAVNVYRAPVDASAGAASFTFAVPGSSFGVAAAPNRKLYESADGSIEQFTPPITASSTPSASVFQGNDPYGIAVDSSNRVFVANSSGNGIISVYTQPFTSTSASAFTITLTSGTPIFGLAFDGSQNLWATDASGTVWEVPAPVTSSSTGQQIFTGMTGAFGITFGP